MKILVLNCGSSSIKYKLFDMDSNKVIAKGGVEKLLNGRKLGWTSLQEIDEIVSTQIAPHIKTNMQDIAKKVKEKYKVKEDSNTLTIDDSDKQFTGDKTSE